MTSAFAVTYKPHLLVGGFPSVVILVYSPPMVHGASPIAAAAAV